MRAKSARASREHRARVAWLRRTTHEPQRCTWPAGCSQAADDPHELLSRARGGSITDPDNVVPLCRAHHDLITRQPWLGAQLGLVLDTPPARGQNVYEAGTVLPMPRRPISIRVSDTADDWIEAEAKRAGVSRAVVLRAMLSTATQHADEVRRRIALTKEV